MAFFRTVCRWIDALNTWVGRGVSWVTFLVVVVVFVDVVMRYAFKTSFVFVQELEWHLFAFIFLMGAGNTLLKDGHVRVDIVYQQLGPKAQAWVNLIGVIFFLIPGSYLIISTSLNFVSNAFAVMEGSPDPGGIPYRWVIKSTIPAGFVLVLLQGISLGIKSAFTILGRETELGLPPAGTTGHGQADPPAPDLSETDLPAPDDAARQKSDPASHASPDPPSGPSSDSPFDSDSTPPSRSEED
jgi:TRAP-type mannitol/chloroaromatic compound transport system permease small subunit